MRERRGWGSEPLQRVLGVSGERGTYLALGDVVWHHSVDVLRHLVPATLGEELFPRLLTEGPDTLGHVVPAPHHTSADAAVARHKLYSATAAVKAALLSRRRRALQTGKNSITRQFHSSMPLA